MTKPMKYHKAAKLLKQNGFTPRQGKGDHQIWRKGSITVTITQKSEISPKVVRDILYAIEKANQ